MIDLRNATVLSVGTQLGVYDERIEPFARQHAIEVRLRSLPVELIRGNGRRFGSFHVRPFRAPWIKLNRHLFAPEFRDELVDTFLHEVAHAVVHLRGGGDLDSHGPIWKSTARVLGCNPAAHAAGARAIEIAKRNLKPILRCPKCGKVFFGYKRRSRAHEYRHSGRSGCEATLIHL
ncbi:MAG: SprT-like domain-containing protein [Myxococcota bacterium]